MQEHTPLKAQAKRLRESLTKTLDIKATVAQSLEIVSHIHGYADWNTAKAVSQPATSEPQSTETLFPRNSPHADKARVRHDRFLREFERLCSLDVKDKERDGVFRLTVEYVPCSYHELNAMTKSIQQLWRDRGTLFRRLMGVQHVLVKQLHRCNEDNLETPYWVLVVTAVESKEPLIFPSIFKEKDKADEMAMKLLITW